MDNEKLIRLCEKQKARAEQIKREESRFNTKKRKEETRRKILAGAWALDEANQREDFKEFVYGKLDGFLTRPTDQALFGLPPAKEEQGSRKQ